MTTKRWIIKREPPFTLIVDEADAGRVVAILPDWDQERKANTALIVSAPELLAAATMAEELIRNGGVVPVNGMTWRALDAAIAKAEGRS